jgi:hypothetical protein
MKFVPTSTGLAPFDLAAREFLMNLRSSRPVELEFLHDRDMIFHRKIFATIGELAKALHRDPESVRAELLYKTGNFQVIGEDDGTPLISINSMSRHHMRDDTLREFWGDACDVILTELLPNVSDPAERDRLATLLPGGVTTAG